MEPLEQLEQRLEIVFVVVGVKGGGDVGALEPTHPSLKEFENEDPAVLAFLADNPLATLEDAIDALADQTERAQERS